MKILSVSENTSGLTLFELVVTIFILGVGTVAMLDAIAPALRSSEDYESATVFMNQARATMSRVETLAYTTLNSNMGNPVNLTGLFGTSAEAAKENFTHKGTAYTPIVAIADASGGTGGLLELNVTVERVTLKTLRSDK
jgi:Tfp pilus assembly protein PilV